MEQSGSEFHALSENGLQHRDQDTKSMQKSNGRHTFVCLCQGTFGVLNTMDFAVFPSLLITCMIFGVSSYSTAL